MKDLLNLLERRRRRVEPFIHLVIESSVHSFHFIPFHSISFHFIPFHSISFHFIPLHSIAFLLPFRVITFRTHRCMTGQAIESLGCHPVRSPHPSYSTPLLLFHPISASSVGSVAPDACHFAVLSSRGG